MQVGMGVVMFVNKFDVIHIQYIPHVVHTITHLRGQRMTSCTCKHLCCLLKTVPYFSLSHPAGKILCILDLSPMHTFPATQVTHHITKPSKGSDTISLHCPPLTHPAQEEEKQSNMSKSAGHKLKKEYSFSRIVGFKCWRGINSHFRSSAIRRQTHVC